MPLVERLVAWAGSSRARQCAVVVDGVSVNYLELAERSASVAAAIAAAHIRAPERHWAPQEARVLAVGTGNHPSFAELLVGGTARNGVCAVLDPTWGAEQARAVLGRLIPDVLVVSSGSGPLAEAGAELGVPTVTLDESGTACSYQSWLSEHDERDLERHLTGGPDASPFLVGFTSGSTGLPKAFYRMRRSWRVSLEAGRSVFALDGTRHTFAPGPLAHGLSLYALAETLDAGATFHGLRTFDRAAMVRCLASNDIQRLVVSPTMLVALCAAAKELAESFPRVRDVLSAGAKLSAPLVRAVIEVLPNARIAEYYGASELGFVTVRGADAETTAPNDVGTAFPGVQLRIRDETGRVLDVAKPGIVWVRSELAAAGYLWGEGGLRQDGPWSTVGDLGLLDADAHLHLFGRGDVVITGGLNVYPAEVETALLQLPGIREAVVFGVPDDYYGSALTAVISGWCLKVYNRARLVAQCEPYLARYKVPRRFYQIDDWPRTPSGKIARAEVEAWVAGADSRLVELPALSAAEVAGG